MKKIGVIGANGYIGKHIVSYLQRYYDVNVDSYDIVAECDLPNYHKVDLTDKESIKGLNLDLDYIFMFAGLTGTYNGFNEYQKFISINELGLLNLLDAIKNSEYRPKVIFPSTRLVYKGVDKSLKEDDLKECKTIYAANKLACEGYLQAYHDSFDIPYTIFRICLPYGNLLSTDYSFGTVGFFINNVGGETLSLHDAAEIIAAKYGAKVTEIPWPERDLRIESSHTYFDDTKIRSLLRNMNPYKKLSDFTNDL